MRPSLKEIAAYLCCPDDRAALATFSDGLRCPDCARTFPLRERRIFELLPSRPYPMPSESASAEYRESYHREFLRPLEIREGARAWGAPEAMPPKWVQLRQRQAREVLQILQNERNELDSVFCDLSAGAGYCSFEAVRRFRLVFHCELSVDARAYASARAAESGLDNIIFVRADYFQPPFRRSMDHLACLDTLIRGPWHEASLLTSIRHALSARGTAVVDFHNWWHNPLRRLGVLPDNFSGNKSYTRRELHNLLASSGIRQFKTQGFLQEADPAHAIGKLLSRVIPPTRLMIRFAGENASAVPVPAAQMRVGAA